jgi:glycosyltransferase involved in cell wall biosynthesis
MRRLLDISVILPTYNEESALEAVVSQLIATLDSVAASWEIIIVNDGSKDRTADIASGLVKRKPEVKHISHATNQGYGVAIRTGLRATIKDWIFVMDSDGQFDSTQLSRLVALTDRADFVQGYRIHRQDNGVRKLNGLAWRLLIRKMFGLPRQISDINCGFKFFKRCLVEESSLISQGAMISTELILRALTRGAIIQEVEVTHYPRLAGLSTGNNPKVVYKAFSELFSLYRQLR